MGLVMLRLVLASSLVLAASPSTPQEDPGPRGRTLFDSHCARCHGIGGAGGEGPSLARPKLRHAADEEALVAIIQNGIEGTGMPPTWQITTSEARDIAGYVRSLGRVEPEPLRGDPQRGRALFEGERGCSNCHAIDGEGGILGPDLSEIGLRRGASYLRQSLVDPDAVVSEEYLQVQAVTAEGREIAGVRLNEDSFTIQLRDASGRFHSLSKLELESLEKRFGRSAMPSYRAELSEDELEDLVAFLATSRGEP